MKMVVNFCQNTKKYIFAQVLEYGKQWHVMDSGLKINITDWIHILYRSMIIIMATWPELRQHPKNV